MNVTESAVLILAYVLDLAIGDPGQLPHPVRIMGWAIAKVEVFLRGRTQITDYKRKNKETREKLTGVLLVVIIVGFTYGLFYFINTILFNSYFSIFTSYLSFVILAYLISTTLATRELIRSAQSVVKALKADHIEDARKNLSCIVGRDTELLGRDKILKATIECLAENASDGIIAPLFYFSIGGLPLAMTYKAINTLDSMVGYKNEKYRDFGWAAAKVDDIANYMPARITGVLITVSTFIIDGLNARNRLVPGLRAFKIMLRDGKNHLSPNSGIPEAAMAGALGIKLGGPSLYEGIAVRKPYIGDEKQSPELRTQITDTFYLKASGRAITITEITSLLGLCSALVLLYARAAL
ncbi:MAG TPA: cobalamin biosynthesis protein CobD [Nitrospirae bacterium]|nr:cobalamin biosynthesis protein CobD [Nitrospirota bacterium]